MSRGRSLATILKGVGVRLEAPPAKPRFAGKVRIVRQPTADPAACVHLFERIHGRRACRYCLTPAPGARGPRRSRSLETGRPLERTIQRQLVTFLRSIGAAVYEFGTHRPKGDYQGTRQSPGIPDLFVFLPLRAATANCEHSIVWIEVKGEGGQLRPAQAEFKARCDKHGYPHITGGLDEVRLFLTSRGFIKER